MPKGRKPDADRNAAFLMDWTKAKYGDRLWIVREYGFASLASAAVIAHRLRRYGRTSAPIDTDA